MAVIFFLFSEPSRWLLGAGLSTAKTAKSCQSRGRYRLPFPNTCSKGSSTLPRLAEKPHIPSVSCNPATFCLCVLVCRRGWCYQMIERLVYRLTVASASGGLRSRPKVAFTGWPVIDLAKKQSCLREGAPHVALSTREGQSGDGWVRVQLPSYDSQRRIGHAKQLRREPSPAAGAS